MRKANKMSKAEQAQIHEELAGLLYEAHETDSNLFSFYLNEHYKNECLAKHGLKALKAHDSSHKNLLIAANALLPKDKKYKFYVIHSELTIEFGTYGSDAFTWEYGLDTSEAECLEGDFEPDYEAKSDIRFGFSFSSFSAHWLVFG